jgi:ABC-2 type transport system ATP-binding protein
MAQTVVEVDRLTKVYDNAVVAVEEVSFEMSEGEILGLLGPNGAGKTTLIQMLLDLVTPTAGTIRILGLPLPKHREEILARVNFSSTYVSMPTSLTVRENLIVFSQLYGLRHPGEKIDLLLKRFEMTGHQHRLTRSLSSGQLTRLSLMKSLLNDPKVLFLDEPTSSLDPDMADKTRRLLRETRDRTGLSILYTSHNMKEMEEISDRILFLHKGKILASGTPQEVLRYFRKENLEEVFLKVARGESDGEEP